MKVSINWLKELVDLRISMGEFINQLPLRSVSIKEATSDFIELDMKGYNRADLLSLRGVAYEVAAITGSKLTFEEPKEAKFAWNQRKLPSTPCRIEDETLCSLQGVAKIDGLKISPSPKEWVKRLEDSGMRSVNNVVDVTNLIMLEYGQPLHSFDASTIKNETITVRAAKNGEEITTLDGKLRKLTPADIILADTEKPIDVAGVMGGKDTETSDSTNTILLTASLFNAQMIMKTANKLGLHSEASKRFQHGLTKRRLLQAFDAAIKMYESLGGKLIALTITGDLEDPVKKTNLTQEKINSLIGVKIKPEKVEEYLKKLGFSLASKGDALRAWEVTVPYWRLDIELEEDLIEEVARMYGYEKIPAEKVSESKPLQKEDPIFQKISDLKNKLVDLGLTEVQTYSFYSTQVLEGLRLKNPKEKLVKIANPISSETQYLRQSIWPNLLEVVGKNIRKGYKDIAVFEIGKVFNVGQDGNPVEDYRLAIALSNETDNPLAELASIAKNLGFEFKESALLEVATHLFHPKRFLAFEKDGKPFDKTQGRQIGGLAEVHLRVLNKLGIEKRVAVLEIELT